MNNIRIKIAIGIILFALVLVVAILRNTPPPLPATLVFTGYSDDGSHAMFSLINHARRYVIYSNPQIQISTETGWTNYYDLTEMSMCRLPSPFSGRQAKTLSAALPAGEQRWKASVSVRVCPDYNPVFDKWLEPLLVFLNLVPSTNEVILTTEESFR